VHPAAVAVAAGKQRARAGFWWHRASAGLQLQTWQPATVSLLVVYVELKCTGSDDRPSILNRQTINMVTAANATFSRD
jgi:hypothetical protein